MFPCLCELSQDHGDWAVLECFVLMCCAVLVALLLCVAEDSLFEPCHLLHVSKQTQTVALVFLFLQLRSFSVLF